MRTTVDGLKLTGEQIAQYITMVEEQGKEREKNFDIADATAFAMGAAVLFFATGQQDKIPPSWIYLPMQGKSPFSLRAATPAVPDDDDPDAGSWGEYQHIKEQHANRPEAAGEDSL